MKNAIEMRHLTKRYGKNRGIEDITMKVEEGDFFGYLGVNGAGKSTSIRCLLGLMQPTSGEAFVLGHRAARGQAEILARVGYVPSEAHFYPSMEAGEVIRYAAHVRGLDCAGEAERLCRRLAVDRKKKVRELSLGNRKKVSIVCALQHKPALILMDEPTSGLDPLMQETFFELLKERAREGAACFLSSHVLQEVKRHCRHVGILRDGRLLKVDTVENLTKTNLRRVKISGMVKPPCIGGISRVEPWGDGCAFSFRGDMKELIGALQGVPVRDMLVEEPSLEEIFKHYYEEGVEE